MVGPTKRKPRFAKSFDIFSASGVLAGMSFMLRSLLSSGAPSRKSHR